MKVGDTTILFSKAVIDIFASIIFATRLGYPMLLITKCERKAPKFIYGDISSLKNNDSISLFFIVLYF